MIPYFSRNRFDTLSRRMSPAWSTVGLTLLISLTAMAQVCPPPSDGRITSPCASSVARDVESRSVQAWLDIHRLPQSDSSILYQYGRTDVRNQIRAMMYNEVLRIIAKDPAKRDAYEQSVYDWIHGLVRANELALYQHAVNDANRWSADPCGWRPDPDVAAAYGLSYNSAAWCSGNPLITAFLFGPPIPSKSYFLGAALKYAYGSSVASLNGGGALPAMQLLSYQMYGYGALPAAGLSTAAAILIYNNAASLVSYISDAALANLVADIAAAGRLGSAVTDVVSTTVGASAATAADASAAAALAAGPAIIIMIAVELGIQAAFQFYEYNQQQQDVSDLNGILAHVRSHDQNLQDWLGDPLGQYKLANTLAANTLPDIPSTRALPRHRAGVDAFFSVFPANGDPYESQTLAYTDSLGTAWEIQTYGGWFLQQSISKSGLQSNTISPTLTITDNNNVVWLVDRVGPNFLISKVQPAPGEVECPADTTGVTPQSALSANHCFRYVASSFPLPDSTLVTLGQAPSFTNEAVAGFDVRTSFSIDITAAGIPAPALSVDNLPPGVTFSMISPGRGKLSGNTNVPPGRHRIRLTALNGTGRATQELNLVVATTVQIISPDNFSVKGGVPTTFTIRATGIPKPSITFHNIPCPKTSLVPDPCLSAPQYAEGFQIPAGMTFKDNGNGTASLSGTYLGSLLQSDAGGVAGGVLRGVVTASNGVNQATQILSIGTSFATDAVLVGALSTTFLPGMVNTAIIGTTGGSGPVSFRTLNLPPPNAPWLRLRDNGNGTATVSGVPPLTDSSYDVSFSICPDTLGGQHICFYRPYTIHVSATPQFTDRAERKAMVCSLNHFCGMPIRTNMLSGTFSLDGRIPSGLILRQERTTGRIDLGWTPTAGGAYPISITATNAAGSSTSTYTFYVPERPNFPTIGTGDIWLMVGQPVSLAIPTTGYPHDLGVTITGKQILPPMSVSLGRPTDLPKGLTFTSTALGVPTGTGILSGTPGPDTEGDYRMRLVANNGAEFRADVTVHVRIAGDVNGDRIVNCDDYAFVMAARGQLRGQATYDARADLNNDGAVDRKDLEDLTSLVATMASYQCRP